MTAAAAKAPAQISSARISDFPRCHRVMFMIDNLLGMGGAEGALLRMVNHLPNFGFDCSIVTFDLSPDKDFVARFNCPVHELPLSRTWSFEAIRTAANLRELTARERPDILHTMFPTSDLWGGPIASFGKDIRVISSRRDMGILRQGKHRVAYRLLKSRFDQVQAVSDAVRNASIANDGLDPARVETVHNGIDLDRIAAEPCWPDVSSFFETPHHGPTIITAVGKVWPVKGVDTFLKGAAIVSKQFPDARFIVAGWDQGAYPDQLKQECNNLGLNGKVAFTGRVKHVVSIMKASDVFCLLSRSEGLSNALLEAMSCGLPCIATAVGGNPEVVVNKETGFLVGPEDATAAAARIGQLLHDPALRRKMGGAGQKRIHQNFTVDRMVSRVASLYSQLLKERAE
jgi:glycosyltransferase involved in cell wall biosynthesis